MAGIDFNICITDEACTYARVASTTPGWYLTPKKWCISSSSGDFSPSRTSSSMLTPWVQQPFSAILPQGTNKLLHSLVIPPNASTYSMTIGEIYFIYEDYYGNEFLYALAQPTTPLEFTPGVSQSYSFLFALNNTTVADTFIIDYTYPQDIQDHNAASDSHINLLAKDGSRLASNILKYETELLFSNDRDIVDKAYIDNLVNRIQNLICPPGSIMWWPKSTPPDGWLVRDGALHTIKSYPELFAAIGTSYGGDGILQFRVPDDRGKFVRGYSSSLDVGFGESQQSGAPNIIGSGILSSTRITDLVIKGTVAKSFYTGAIYMSDTAKSYYDVENSVQGTNGGLVSFDASRCSAVYKNNLKELRPENRNYLPIIKF